MPETIQSDMVKADSGLMPYPSGTVTLRKYDFPVAAADLAQGNVFEILPLRAGETVVDVILKTTDLDTGTPAVVLDVGDRDTADLYIDGSTVGQAGGVDRTDADSTPTAYAAGNALCVKVAVAPDTAAAGTISIWALIA